MPNVQQGAIAEFKGGSTILQTGRLKVDISEEISYLNVDKSLLLHLLSKIKKEAVDRVTNYWQTQERKKDIVAYTAISGQVPAGVGGADITVAAADVQLFAPGDIILIPAFSQTRTFIVISISNPSGGPYTVKIRAVDQLATVGLAATGDLFRLGNSFEDGSGVGTPISEQPSQDFNHIQIFQTPYGVTTTAKHLGYRGTTEWDKIKFEAGVDHAFKLEKSLFFGQRRFDAAGASPSPGTYSQGFMGGLRDFISTNVSDQAASTLTQDELDAWIISWTKYGNKMPAVIAGETVFAYLVRFAQSQVVPSSWRINMTRNEKTFGIAMTKYVTAYGDEVLWMPHRELLTGASLGGTAFGLDLTDLKYQFLQGLDTHTEVDVQPNGDKKFLDEIRTWCSLKVGNQKKHGLLTGVI